MKSAFNYSEIPDYMRAGLCKYIVYGVEPGGFLSAVLSNDLGRACGKADNSNMWVLPMYMAWLYNEVPGISWGSGQLFEGWMDDGGMKGRSQWGEVEAGNKYDALMETFVDNA